MRCLPQNALWQVNTSHGPDPLKGRGSTCRPQWRAAEQYHLAIGQPNTTIVLGTGVQDTMCAEVLQHAIATMRPGTAQKRFPVVMQGIYNFMHPL